MEITDRVAFNTLRTVLVRSPSIAHGSSGTFVGSFARIIGATLGYARTDALGCEKCNNELGSRGRTLIGKKDPIRAR